MGDENEPEVERRCPCAPVVPWLRSLTLDWSAERDCLESEECEEAMIHPLTVQLRFARSEFIRCFEGVPPADACRRVEPMNCLSWTVGHLASQENIAPGLSGPCPAPAIAICARTAR